MDTKKDGTATAPTSGRPETLDFIEDAKHELADARMVQWVAGFGAVTGVALAVDSLINGHVTSGFVYLVMTAAFAFLFVQEWRDAETAAAIVYGPSPARKHKWSSSEEPLMVFGIDLEPKTKPKNRS